MAVNPGYTRRQELRCTLDDLSTYSGVILYEGEVLYVKLANGKYAIKIGDGETNIANLPYVVNYSDISTQATNAAASATAAAGSATAASGSAQTAEAYAKGTKNGTSVPATDPAYHNNAKYYAEQAAANAEAAAEEVLNSKAEAVALALAYDDETAYKIGNLLTYLGKQYYCIADAPAGTLPTNTTYFEEKSVADIIEMIKTGAITVGKANLANNFDSKMVLTDNSGYLYRTTGGALEVGEQNRVKKIIGASVPIIQLARSISSTYWQNYSNSHTSVTFSDGVASLTALSTDSSGMYNYGVRLRDNYAYSLKAGHKYLVCVDIKSSVNRNFVGELYSNSTDVLFGSVTANTWTTKRVMFTPSSDITKRLLVYPATVNEGDTWQVRNAILFDLTATFGTTVANRLYALEQAQAGTGIAKVKEILVKDYYPYNVTTFTHTKTSGKVNNGFNQWKEIYESGSIDLTTGRNTDGNNQSRVPNANIIEVFPSTTYHFYRQTTTGTTYIVYYDEAKEFISSATLMSAGTGDANFTTPSNAKYIRFVVPTPVANQPICINLHWDGERDGEYEAYQEWNYPVQDIELKGILSLDAQDNWVADGDEYLPSGVVNRKFGLLDLSTLTFAYDTQRQVFYAPAPSDMKKTTSNADKFIGFSNKYVVESVNGISTGSGMGNIDKGIACGYVVASDRLVISDSSLSTDTTTISGYLLYELATPTESSADPYTELQNDSNWGTEKWIDTRDVSMPVFSTCEYIPDLKAKLETAPESPEEDGDYIMHRENGLNSYGSLSTWLSANGYNKLQDLSSGITDVAGLTYNIKKMTKCGNVVNISIKAINNTGSTINANTTLFSIPSASMPTEAISIIALTSDVAYRVRLNQNAVYVNVQLENDSTIYINASWCV